MKTLLIISGGIEAVPGIKTAKEMGFYVVASDMNPNAPGLKLADDRIITSTYDVEATATAAQKYHHTVRHIDGVMCIASDVPLTVASVAHKLGLPGIPIDAAMLAMDKLAMKRKFSSDGIPIPWFSPVESVRHLFDLVREQGYPLVLKPVDSRGARGVLRLMPDIDLDWAFHIAQSNSPTNRVMIEIFLPGPQVSTESIMIDGVAYTAGFSDRNYEYLEKYAPYIIENGGDLPSCLPSDVQNKCRSLVQQAALSMGVTNGVVKGDIVVHEGEPYVIELAARLSGGYFCTHEIPLNTDVDFVGQAIRLALGMKLNLADIVPRYQRGVAQRYLFPKPGRVIRISDISKVAQRSGIALCEVRVNQGDIIGPIDSHTARAGVVITTGETRDQAIDRALHVLKTIEIETVPIK
ncbi:MAG: ATP-grasp domain-containing protein [Desulfobacterales bacterium]